MEENIGVLLHKLTKYQTLLSNTGSYEKKNIYSQKINSYSQKLNKIGVNQNNINQLGGLIGGDDQTELQERLRLMKERRTQIGTKSLKVPSSNINNQVQNIGSRFNDAITALNNKIATNVAEIQRLNTENAEKERQRVDLETQKIELERQKVGLENEKVNLEKEKSDLEKQKVGLEEKNQSLVLLSNEVSSEFDAIAKMFEEFQESADQNSNQTVKADEAELTKLETLLQTNLAENPTLDTQATQVYKSLGVTTSPVEQSQPPVEQSQPPVEQSQPPVEQTQPPVEQSQPQVEQTQPPVEQTQPPVEQETE
jgi:chromosome segregation ATPase